MKIVYALYDPISSEARYIGLTSTSTTKRLARHMEHARRSPSRPLAKWLLALKAIGFKPEVKVLETTEDVTREAIWIKRYLEMGANLLNETPNGDGRGNGLGGDRPKAKVMPTLSSPPPSALVSDQQQGGGA